MLERGGKLKRAFLFGAFGVCAKREPQFDAK